MNGNAIEKPRFKSRSICTERIHGDFVSSKIFASFIGDRIWKQNLKCRHEKMYTFSPMPYIYDTEKNEKQGRVTLKTPFRR